MIESYPAYARNYSGHCNVPSCTLISKNSSSGARFASRIAALANHSGEDAKGRDAENHAFKLQRKPRAIAKVHRCRLMGRHRHFAQRRAPCGQRPQR